MDETIKGLLYLVKLGLFTNVVSSSEDEGDFNRIDWNSLFNISIKHGINGITIDGLQQLIKHSANKNLLESVNNISLKLPKMQWFASSLVIEQNYERHIRVMAELANFYKSQGIKMLVAKGYGLSLNYPVPNHRPLGDIDIWLFGEQKKGDAAIEKEKRITIDYGHHHHTIFNYKGITVENYSDFLCVPGHRKNVGYEKLLKRLAYEESVKSQINGEEVYFPSANFNALFILKHSATHFAATEMNLRQLIDWGTFVYKHGKEVDWNMVKSVAKEYNLYRFMNCQNALCIDYLGFPSDAFPTFERDEALEDRVIHDILHPEFNEKVPSGFFKGLLFKYKRWKANSWKHKITFPESLAETLLTQLFAHLLKPASLKN